MDIYGALLELVRRIERLESNFKDKTIPTETWRDVTGECEVQPNGEIWHKHKNGCVTNATYYSVFSDPAGYRLRKVLRDYGDAFGGKVICGERYAFIIEKRDA
jgi:hypothetical protein